MNYIFGDFVLDTDRAELRSGGTEVPLEPRAYSLLCFLVEARHKVLSKDEIIAEVWGGRIISDAALSTALKTLRHAIGDSGAQQRFVRTVRRRGFRFVAEVETETPAHSPARTETTAASFPLQTESPPTQQMAGGKPSLMILPFQLVGERGSYSILSDAIPHELIQGLSRLRWLRIIARGTAFRFRGPAPDLASIGRQFDVRYFLSGSVEAVGAECFLTVELSKCPDSTVLWSERYRTKLDAVHEVRERIVADIIVALEMHIPQNEARDAHLNVSENLDAWANYHLGLNYMFRFTDKANALARRHFEHAIVLDPRFARAHAGLSFTRFQDAFVKYTPDTAPAIADARRHAERGVELDPLDPFCNANMGRTFWLGQDIEGGMGWLERAVSLSPNFAQGLYSQSFAEAMTGSHVKAFDNSNSACNLSPLDPLLYAMHGVRAFALIEAGNYAEATIWADKAARSPGAHFLIPMIAVVAHSLQGNFAAAETWVRRTRTMRPDAGIEQFHSAFPFTDPAMRRRLSECLTNAGF
ncbi:MAG: winged helix-turn-helix domain-containing tetratricopeptide repeat protein [Halocynthiibacter sp.]